MYINILININKMKIFVDDKFLQKFFFFEWEKFVKRVRKWVTEIFVTNFLLLRFFQPKKNHHHQQCFPKSAPRTTSGSLDRLKWSANCTKKVLEPLPNANPAGAEGSFFPNTNFSKKIWIKNFFCRFAPFGYLYFVCFSTNEPELGAWIDPGMAFNLFPSSILDKMRRDSNPQLNLKSTVS